MNWEEREQERYVDKSAWPAGPWRDEPDRVEWRYRALPCLSVRSTVTGALCGYVGLPPGHPARRRAEEESLSAHGGLTYSAPCDEGGKICHAPLPGEPADAHWVGFDCGHAGDFMPRMPVHFDGDAYRDLAYVRAEVESLADQVRALEEKDDG